MNREALIREIVAKIVERFRPRRIVLFGSQASGRGGAHSDIDLFIEMESEKAPPERAIEVDRLFGVRDWAMDLVVYTPAEVQRERRIAGGLVNEIESEGVPLYVCAGV